MMDRKDIMKTPNDHNKYLFTSNPNAYNKPLNNVIKLSK